MLKKKESTLQYNRFLTNFVNFISVILCEVFSFVPNKRKIENKNKNILFVLKTNKNIISCAKQFSIEILKSTSESKKSENNKGDVVPIKYAQRSIDA